MKKNLLSLSFFVLAYTLSAQDFHLRDSLITTLQKTENDSIKKKVIGALYIYYYSFNRDSSNYYGSKIIELAKATNDTRLLYNVYGYLGTQNRTEGNYSASLEWNTKTLELR